MDEHPTSQDPLAAAYAASVDFERCAWRELHAHAPGTPERIRAWKDWSEAISRTNDAWRLLSARRFAASGSRSRTAEGRNHAGA